MGRESRYCCQTCRVHIYLGDASYSTWLDHVESVEAFDALPPSEAKDWWTNQNVRRVLVEHQGHEGFFWNRETLFETREGDVVVRGQIIEDFWEYRRVSLNDTFNPNLDPSLCHATWYRFTMPNGQEVLRAAPDVDDADWHGASEVDRFRDAKWEPTHDGGWLLYGTKENGQRLPIDVIEGTHEPDLGDVESQRRA